MATSRNTKGFIQLEWVCPNCNSRNPGPQKTCENCGAPQPENVQFYAPAEAKLIQGENAVKIAQAGADIHCGFCGTRNSSTATVCSQCGGDLKEGRARAAGQELQRQAAGVDVKCTNCGEVNPSTRTMCAKCGAPLPRPAPEGAKAPSAAAAMKPAVPVSPSAPKPKVPWVAIGGIVACLAVICIGAILLFSIPTKSITATVSDVHWETSVPVEEVRAVDYSNKSGSPPAGAYNVACHDETTQVCEEKTIDRGNGYAEVVEECHEESTQYCSYTVDEWTTIQTYTLEGHDYSPIYSQPSLSSDQRLGDQSVNLTVYFTGEGEQYAYNPENASEFQQFTIGSTWTLSLNALGGVVSVER